MPEGQDRCVLRRARGDRIGHFRLKTRGADEHIPGGIRHVDVALVSGGRVEWTEPKRVLACKSGRRTLNQTRDLICFFSSEILLIIPLFLEKKIALMRRPFGVSTSTETTWAKEKKIAV